jgi:hypothetical protein
VKALIREIQRDPLRPVDILHLDLYEVKADEAVTVSVPVRLIGVPDGVRNFGGVLDQVLYSLEVEVLPADIPDHIDLDVTNLTIGHSLFVRDVTVTKARILNGPDSPVCSVVAPRTEEAPAAPEAEVAAPTEPELMRRPKARPKSRPCTRSWGWATPARSTRTPATTQASGWRTTWPPGGISGPFAEASGPGRRRAPSQGGRSSCSSRRRT